MQNVIVGLDAILEYSQFQKHTLFGTPVSVSTK